ncbi:hypothetical protein CP556_21425 [Natrinema sp. CBA1119]|uniref:hypothetical protein n=1 Tax=Natrinema sp. CBA1119 TaxID=1608465 RepID=UPI000BF72D8B|nr:hypothetical protein [Natrinema sp. CBA1119]PGF14423.1 hypothetical protein CP556_21425 [Natrinema sp. CBA1119]
MSSESERWERAGGPMPTSAVRLEGPDRGECAFGCGRRADYLVKVENVDGHTAKTRVCEPCNDEHRIWAERHLPPESDGDSDD